MENNKNKNPTCLKDDDEEKRDVVDEDRQKREDHEIWSEDGE